MKRAALPLAIASLITFSVPTRAVMLSPHGLGQVLLYPYYTVNKTQDTLLSVTNTDFLNVKVVKLRVKEGLNGRTVADFDVFLAPNDVWTAIITQVSDDGGALIRTSDRSCTMPEVPAAGLALSSAGYDGSLNGVPADDGPHDITRTREGYIELIASADITPGTATYAAVLPDASGVPANCGALSPSHVAADAAAPTATLFGAGTIVNVGDGIFFGYSAEALSDFTANPLYGTDGSPRLDQANTAGTDGVRAIVDAGGVPLAIDYASGIDAVSAVLMRSEIASEWHARPISTGPGSRSGTQLTDWVVTFPTKSWYVDKTLYPSNATNPFAEPFDGGVSQVTLTPRIFNREAGMPVQLSCPPLQNCDIPQPIADFSVSVFSFRHVPSTGTEVPSDLFGSSLVATRARTGSIAPYGADGWAALELRDADGGHYLGVGFEEISGRPVVLGGLPAIGFMGYDIVDANANAESPANYSGAFPLQSGAVECTNCTMPFEAATPK